MINHLQLHFKSVCFSVEGMFCCNFVADWCSNKTKSNVITIYTLSSLIEIHLLIHERVWCMWRTCIIVFNHAHKSTSQSIVIQNKNVYSNQKEELDKRLNHSEHSIFIEYLHTIMINRQKKIKITIQMENEENSVSDIALYF